MESNAFTAQASWPGLGVGPLVVVSVRSVTSASVVGGMGGLGLGFGPVLLPAESII